MIELVKAGTSDALVINAISKRSFDSDVEIGAPSREVLLGICLYSFIQRWQD